MILHSIARAWLQFKYINLVRVEADDGNRAWVAAAMVNRSYE